MEYFNEQEKLLLLEANLTLATIADGLDCLKNADTYKKGLYYQAFFSLSIGIERIIKLIIIDKYRIENQGEFPSNKIIRNYGHELYKMVKEYDPKLLENKIYNKVIIFLDNFAKKTRYYNLDILTGKQVEFLNPLSNWNEIEKEILEEYNVKIKPIANKKILANLINQTFDIMYLNNSLQTVNSGMGILEEFETRETFQEYNVLVCYKIIKSLIGILIQNEREFHLYPYLWEIFDFFSGNSTDYEIRKKSMWLDIVK